MVEAAALFFMVSHHVLTNEAFLLLITSIKMRPLKMISTVLFKMTVHYSCLISRQKVNKTLFMDLEKS